MRDTVVEAQGVTGLRVLVRGLIWLAVAAAVVLGVVYGLGRYHQAKAAAAAPQFFTVPASMGPVAVTVSGSGSIDAVTTQSVAPAASGRVAKVDVAVGQRVQAGDPLYELSDTQGLAQQVAAARASLAQAQAQLATLQNPTAGVDPRTAQQQGLRVQQAQLSLQQAQTALARDQAAAVTNATARSLVAGNVTAVLVLPGAQVNAGAALATVQPAGNPTVTVPVPEEDLPYLPLGTAATVAIPSLARTMTGTVTAIGTAPAPGQVTIPRSGAPAQTEQLFALTVTLAGSPAGAPQGASVTVNFTPSNNPPSAYAWSDTGSIAYPTAETVTAPQAGTVGEQAAVGATLAVGQTVATLTNPNAPQTLQQDQVAITQAQITLQGAQLTLDQTLNPTPATPQAIAVQQAAVASDDASLQQRELALTGLVTAAPIAGTVTAVGINPGDNVGPNTAVAVTLQSAAGYDALTPVDELDIGKVKVGQTAQVQVGAFPNAQYVGTVSAVSPTAVTQNGVSNYDVTVALKDQQNLLPGMSATVVIQVAAASSTLRVPAQAVTTIGATGNGIVRLLQGGRAVPTPVQVGLVGTDYTQILSGIQPGQAVIAGQATTGTGNAGAFFRGPGGFGGGAIVRGSGARQVNVGRGG